MTKKKHLKVRVLPVVAGALVLGLLVQQILAQGSLIWFAINAESGSLTGQVEAISDNNAADGGAISFTNQSGGTFTLPNPGSWTNATGNLAGMASECGNLSFIFGQPGTNRIIAGIAQRGLWATTNDGASWTQLGIGSGSATITNRPNGVVYDPNNTNTYWVAGIYNGAGIYRTTDGGNTFTQLGSIGHNDGVGVDLNDPNRQTLLAGGHEQSQKLYKSTNGGQSWTEIGGNLPSGTGFSSFPYVVNSTTYLMGITSGWGGGAGGIYRSADAGQSWTKVGGTNATGAAVRTPNGTLYWPAGGDILMSTNQGQSWTTAYSGIRGDTNLVALPDNRVVGFGSSGRMVAGSNTSWSLFGADMPSSLRDHWAPQRFAVNYQTGDIFVDKWDCSNNVLSDAVYRLH